MTESRKLNGQIISTDELRTRWAAQEASSPRFGRHYAKFMSADALGEISKLDVDEFSENQITNLNAALAAHRGEGSLSGGLLGFIEPYNQFICEEWSENQLSTTIVVPGLGLKPFTDFISESPPLDSNGQPHPKDPRTIAASIPSLVWSKFTYEPVIVVPYEQSMMLLEGTLRSILFSANRKPNDKLLVWRPVPSNAVH